MSELPNRRTLNEEAEPDGYPEEVSRSFKSVQLRLLMKEREEEVLKLVDLDYSIWVLEEFFRGGSPLNASSSGTTVPKRSLSSRKEKGLP